MCEKCVQVSSVQPCRVHNIFYIYSKAQKNTEKYVQVCFSFLLSLLPTNHYIGNVWEIKIPKINFIFCDLWGSVCPESALQKKSGRVQDQNRKICAAKQNQHFTVNNFVLNQPFYDCLLKFCFLDWTFSCLDFLSFWPLKHFLTGYLKNAKLYLAIVCFQYSSM